MEAPTYSFEPIGLDHIQMVSDLEMRIFPDDWFGFYQMQAEITAGECLGLFKGGNLLAYALIRRDGRLIDLTRVGVIHGMRGRKIGSQLLTFIVDKYVGFNIILQVRRTNNQAIKLYQRIGFKTIGLVPGSYTMMYSSIEPITKV